MAKEIKKTYDVLLIGVGSMAWPAYEAAQHLENQGISCAVINLRFIKPLDTDLLDTFISKSHHIVVVEEGSAIGGVFYHILHFSHSIIFTDIVLSEVCSSR